MQDSQIPDKVNTIQVQVTDRLSISQFTGLPIAEIKEGTVFQIGPCVSQDEYLALRSAYDQRGKHVASQQEELERLRGLLKTLDSMWAGEGYKSPDSRQAQRILAPDTIAFWKQVRAALNPPAAESENSDGISIDARTAGK